MKVLILHQHFNTPEKGGAVRSYYLAKALVDGGIDVVVITGHNEPQERIEVTEGITIHYLPVQYDNSFGFYKRSFSFLKYINHAVRVAGTLKNVDVCYAISVPLTIGLAAQWIKRKYNIPYIFEVGDLWPDAPIQMGFVKNYFFKQALFALERSVYEGAKSIVALSPMIERAIQKKVPGKIIHLIPNMSDTEFYTPQQKNPATEKKFGTENNFVVSYIGALGVANGLDYFLECARASQKESLPIHFILCGDGAMRAYLQRTAKQLNLQNLSILPFQNRDGVKEIMSVTDAVFVCYKPVPILETGSPNKYFDGLAAGKLIIVNMGGWIKEEIGREQCGISSDPANPANFVTKIMPYLQSKSLLAEAQRYGRALAERKYSRILLGERFRQLFQ